MRGTFAKTRFRQANELLAFDAAKLAVANAPSVSHSDAGPGCATRSRSGVDPRARHWQPKLPFDRGKAICTSGGRAYGFLLPALSFSVTEIEDADSAAMMESLRLFASRLRPETHTRSGGLSWYLVRALWKKGEWQTPSEPNRDEDAWREVSGSTACGAARRPPCQRATSPNR